ncbi:MAG: LysR family transcriptional regulator [candidate division NC10 bacterium]|nr:LysR family transcriptional regulator [candidate division NC10 bacterium]
MTFEMLKLYCDIVRLHSFSQGAAANQISQSAASQSIQQLEAELDVLLIDRSKRPFMLTPGGRTFYDGCQSLLQGFEKVRAAIASTRTQIAGSVRLAAIYSVGLHLMSDHMQRFMSLYPLAQVRLEYLHPHKVVDAVLNDEADLGILSYPPANRSLTILPWRSETMVFVCHPTHRLARRKTITSADMNGEKFVAFDADLRIRKAIDRCLRQHEARVTMVMEFDNIETIKQAIAIGAGVSILPKPTILKEVGNRTLAAVPLAMTELIRPLGIIHRRGKVFTPTVARFLELLRECIEKPAPARP